MLKRISKDQLRLGMYVRALEAPWLSHPFWKSRFLLSDPDDLEALRASDVEAVTIDLAKGRGLDPPTSEEGAIVVAEAVQAHAARVRQRRKAGDAPAIDVTPCSASEEIGRAERIVRESKRVVTRLFDDVRLGSAIDVQVAGPLVEQISASVSRNPSALISVARLRARDEYTYVHSVAVAALMVNLGRQLGMSETETHDLGVAGMLHDIGKMTTPKAVLNKPGKLTDEEAMVMRSHSERGWDLLNGLEGVPAVVLDVCRHHHERYDGTGYPDRLAGNAIALAARIATVCDVYDAMTSTRPYKDAWSPAEALVGMFRWEGHFDPFVLKAFIRSVGVYPVGTLVRLQSDRLALVVDQNPEDLTRPVVRPFMAAGTRGRLPMRDLDLLKHAGADRIASRENPEDWKLDPWDSHWPAMLAQQVPAFDPAEISLPPPSLAAAALGQGASTPRPRI